VLGCHRVEKRPARVKDPDEFDLGAVLGLPEQALDMPVHQPHDGEAEGRGFTRVVGCFLG
jgi:hypothetical protein